MITLVKDAIGVGESEGITIVPGSETGQDKHSFQIDTIGSPTNVIVSVLGTITGSKYEQLLQHTFTTDELASGSAIIHLINKPMPRIKVSIDALDGGMSPLISVYYFKGSRSV